MQKAIDTIDMNRQKAIAAFNKIIDNHDNFHNEKCIENIRMPLKEIFLMFDNMFESMHVNRRKIRKKFDMDFDYYEKTLKTAKTRDELLAIYDNFFELAKKLKEGMEKIRT